MPFRLLFALYERLQILDLVLLCPEQTGFVAGFLHILQLSCRGLIPVPSVLSSLFIG
jgi:hypothetical protein